MKRIKKMMIFSMLVVILLAMVGCGCLCSDPDEFVTSPTFQPDQTDGQTTASTVSASEAPFSDDTNADTKATPTCTPIDKVDNPIDTELVGGNWADLMPDSVFAPDQGMIGNSYSMDSDGKRIANRVIIHNVDQETMSNWAIKMIENGWDVDSSPDSQINFFNTFNEKTSNTAEPPAQAAGLDELTMTVEIYKNSSGEMVEIVFDRDEDGTYTMVVTYLNK